MRYVLLTCLLVLSACAPDRQIGMAGRDYEGKLDLMAARKAQIFVEPGVTGLADNPILDHDPDGMAGPPY